MYTCAEMTSSEIANLQLVTHAKKNLYYEKSMLTMVVNNSTNINNMNNYLSPQIIELVEILFVILSKFFFPF